MLLHHDGSGMCCKVQHITPRMGLFLLQNESYSFIPIRAYICIENHHMKSKALIRKLKRIRRKQGVSQVEMAKKLGISQNAISKIELGQSELTLERLYKMADILEIDLLDFLREI